MGCRSRIAGNVGQRMLKRRAELPTSGAPARRGGRRDRPVLSAHRSFDPQTVGRLESQAWVAYYRRRWLDFVRAGIAVGRLTFGLSWPATLRCSWLILRANQLWAPFPDNDPEAARRVMERFYRIVQRWTAEPFDPTVAAELEVQWWSVHRRNQHIGDGSYDEALADALARLYAHVYGVPEASVRCAAEQRALAMRHSDRWVSHGCPPGSGLIEQERAALIRSYAALRIAVERA